MGSIRTGDNPDFALSPDGSRLYVASITEGDTSELAVIDTAAGAIVQRSAVEDREVGDVIPSFSTMAVSGDGLALRIVRDTPKTQDADMFLLATFDTTTESFCRTRCIYITVDLHASFLTRPRKSSTFSVRERTGSG